MRAVLGVSFAVLAAGDQVMAQPAQPAQPAQATPDVTMGQAELANQMGAYYRSIYAPGVPAMTPGAAPQAQPAPMAGGGMGGFGGSYGPMGTQVGQAYDGAFGGSPSQVQAQQSQLANQLGGFYRSQYVSPAMEAQIREQQAAQAKQAAQQQAQEAKAKSGKDSKAPEVLVAAAPAAPTPAPVPVNAGDCTTMEELKEWFKARSDNIKKYVPKDYQNFAMKSVQSDFDTNKKRLEDGPKKAPDGPVKGPLMLDDTDKESDSMLDQFKQKVSEDAKEVEETAGNWMDEVSKKFKSGIDSAASAVEGKVDKTADEVSKKVKDIKDKHDKDAAPEKLLAQETGTSPVLLLLPCIGLGVAAGVYLRRRASEDDELAPVYHMQV
mmetsp:Transcript_34273/g.42201  ORF Transcript_34273/g.42201 Transcript_34273/m.42201 type:complete len:379 (+) Transcript_34273:60-1196(+)